jgi:hypothetical protein
MLQEAPQIFSKLDENRHLGISVSIGCAPGSQDHQNGVPRAQTGAPFD